MDEWVVEEEGSCFLLLELIGGNMQIKAFLSMKSETKRVHESCPYFMLQEI